MDDQLQQLDADPFSEQLSMDEYSPDPEQIEQLL